MAVILRDRRGTSDTRLDLVTHFGSVGVPVKPPHFCVAGMALDEIYLRFVGDALESAWLPVTLRLWRGRSLGGSGDLFGSA